MWCKKNPSKDMLFSLKVAKEDYNKKPSQKLLKSHQKEIYFFVNDYRYKQKPNIL